ncbi:MAG: hypothetical protein ABI948_01720 [Thermoleophilia bacterium]
MRWPWQRAETLNEKLMREAGLGPEASGEPRSGFLGHLSELMPSEEQVDAATSFLSGRSAIWHDSAVTGLARTREWDVTAFADAPELEGKEVRFDVLPDRTILVEDEVGDTGLAPLAEAVEVTLPPPYRAWAVRRTDAGWAIAARAITVVELQDQPGDAIEITDRDGVRELKIDGERSFGSVPALEQLAGAQFSDYALQAQRLDGDLWEVRIDPL